MKIGLFAPSIMNPMSKGSFQCFANLVYEEIVKHGGDMDKYGNCLCEYESLPEIDIALCHPHDFDSCHAKIKDHIGKEKQLEFYILALNKHERIDSIGKYPNLRYIKQSDPGDENSIVHLLNMIKE